MLFEPSEYATLSMKEDGNIIVKSVSSNSLEPGDYYVQTPKNFSKTKLDSDDYERM